MRGGSAVSVGQRWALGAFTAATLCVAAPGCSSPYGAEEVSGTQRGGATVAKAKTCATIPVRVRDGFDGRTDAVANGWKKGRVSDALPTIATPSSDTTAVMTSRVAQATDDEAKYTSYVEREIPATGCFAAEFMVEYTEAAPFPKDAWTYFFWIDAADDLNISMFRRADTVRFAVQRGGSEISRLDIQVSPQVWTKIKVEVELALARPTISVRVDDGAAQRMESTEPLAAPYFVSFGTWSRGAVPTHEFSFDDVALSY